MTEGSDQIRDICSCFNQGGRRRTRKVVTFHAQRQDETASGWLRLLDMVEQAVTDGREVFRPLAELTAGERRQVITLPASIGSLTQVKHLNLYGSNLVRIPPEIGAMTSLEEFTPYTSYRLHWFPYELRRCSRLRSSTVSTRALYGNYKYRPPFPSLTPDRPPWLEYLDPGVWGAQAVRTCSVCDEPLTAGPHQVWISLGVGSDILPLLVNACSAECLAKLPTPAQNHVPTPHRGGPDLPQPPASW